LGKKKDVRRLRLFLNISTIEFGGLPLLTGTPGIQITEGTLGKAMIMDEGNKENTTKKRG